jgi:hypothetical protein
LAPPFFVTSDEFIISHNTATLTESVELFGDYHALQSW